MVERCSHRRHSSGHYSVCGYGLVEDTMSFDASKVERYTMSDKYERPFGRYVEVEDFDAAVQRIAELEAELGHYREEIFGKVQSTDEIPLYDTVTQHDLDQVKVKP